MHSFSRRTISVAAVVLVGGLALGILVLCPAGWGFWIILAVLSVPIVYFLLGLLAIGTLGLCAGVGNVVSEQRVKARMKSKSRWLHWREAESRARDHRGTLLIESPTIGWAITRAWWTEEDVLANAPLPVPESMKERRETLPHPFDVWCHKEYTDLEEGKALLVAVWNGQKHARRIARSVRPAPNIVDVWSGSIFLADVRPADRQDNDRL